MERNTDKVYILMRADWDSDYYYESIVSAYQKEEEAEAEKDRLTKIEERKDANEYYDRFEEKLDSLINYHLGKITPREEDAGEWVKWWDEYQRIENTIRNKFKSKYPNMVSSYCANDNDTIYYVKAVDFV